MRWIWEVTVAADGRVIRYCEYRNDFALVSRVEKRDREYEGARDDRREGTREGGRDG